MKRLQKKARARLLLVSLSPARQKILLEDPEIILELLGERHSTPIPGSLEFDEPWVDLQRALFDFLWSYGADDERAEGLAPRTGASLLEDETIDAARLVPPDRVRSIAQWVTELPEDFLARVAKQAAPSPASRLFGESLGARGREPSRVAPTALAPDFARLRAFYADLLRTGHAVLSIRFRE